MGGYHLTTIFSRYPSIYYHLERSFRSAFIVQCSFFSNVWRELQVENQCDGRHSGALQSNQQGSQATLAGG